MRKAGVVLMIAAALVATTPAAPAEKRNLAGIWEGTVGSKPIRACFNEQDWGTFGGYYYLSHLNAIPLQQPRGAPQTFVEGYDESDAKAPRWTIENVADGKLAANWRRGSKRLSIHMTRMPAVKLGAYETPCGSMSFHRARLQGLRMVRQPEAKDGVRYTRLVLDHRGHFGGDLTVETFELEGNSPAVRRINRRVTPSQVTDEDGWLPCITGWNSGPHGEWSETVEPRMFTRRWLTVAYELGYYCGGAHPDSSAYSLTFDRQTGREVDLYQWLNQLAIERVINKSQTVNATKLRPSFRELILRERIISDPGCSDVLRRSDYWGVELTRTGFVFTPALAHAEGGCSDAYPMSFKALAPYLSAEGKKNVAALQAEVAAKR